MCVRVILAICLLAPLAAAEEKKISIEFRDADVRKVAAVIASFAGYEVAVADDVAGRKVTVKLDQIPVRTALETVARTVNAKVVELSKGVFRIESVSWKEKVRGNLETTQVNIDFQDTPISDALNFLSEFAEVGIAVDPKVHDEKSADELLLTLRADEIKVKNVLELITLTKGLEYDLRWGCVFIATAARLAALPEHLLPPEAADAGDAEKKLRTALRGRIAFSFDAAPLTDVLEFIRAMKGINIVMTEPGKLEAVSVTATVGDASVEDALALLLAPRGVPMSIRDGVLMVGKTDGEKPPAPVESVDLRAAGDRKINLNFDETPLSEALDFISRYGRIAIQLDPAAARGRPDDLLVSMRMNDVTVKYALSTVARLKGLAFLPRWSGVVFSTPERLRTFPATVLPAAGKDAPEWETSLRAALRGELSFEFDGASVKSALDHIRVAKSLNIVVEPAAKELAEAAQVTLTVDKMSVLDALCHVLVPRGLTLELTSEVVLVRKRR